MKGVTNVLGAQLPILPPREPQEDTVNTGLLLPKSLRKRLDEIAKADGYSRNEVIVHFIRWALQQYEAERAAEADKKDH